MTEQEWLTSDDPKIFLNWACAAIRGPTTPNYLPDRFRCLTERQLSLLDNAFVEHLDMNMPALRSSSFLSASTMQTACAILRDIFGNPYRPPILLMGDAKIVAGSDRYTVFLERWLRWHDGTILRMAEAIYDDRDFARMPEIADALEEAGCTDEEMLNHCRGLRRGGSCNFEHEGKAFSVSGTTIQLNDDWTPKKESPKAAYLPQCECRGTGWHRWDAIHVRGCWVLDLLLGKS